MFRVIIAGGREFNDYDLLEKTMDALLKNVTDDIVIVCGEARGADSLGKRYATNRGYEVHSFPADWDKHGKSAGYIRNKQMAENADACVCFWDRKSKGTKHMIELAEKHRLQLRIKYYGNT